MWAPLSLALFACVGFLVRAPSFEMWSMLGMKDLDSELYESIGGRRGEIEETALASMLRSLEE